jgi:cystathionine gamma-synthase
MPDRPPQPSTVAIHAGSRLTSRSRPVTPDIHVAAVSYFDSAADLDASLDGKDFVYTRIAGQNASLLEEAVAALEGAPACAAFASGMAALRAVLDAQGLRAGDAVVMPADAYGMSQALIKAHAASRGLVLHALSLSTPESVAAVRSVKPKLVLAESMANPLLSVTDLAALSEACRGVGAVLAVDATFASPALQRPLALGADYALHSTTKWINGHSDAMGGVVSGSAERLRPLRAARVMDGAVMGPFEAYLTLRGLRTLPIRMRAHSEGALAVAQQLAASPLVEHVLYPGLASHPQHAVAKRMFSGGFGGMLAFEIKGGDKARALRFLESVKLALPAPSLGDVATLVMHAASAASRRLSPAERAAAGIRDNLIRVSVGLEDPSDIAEDLLQATAQALE